MKIQKLRVGATIEVGDYLLNDSWAGKSWFKIVRTTEKFAVAALNDIATVKFPRVVQSIVRPCGKRDLWDTVKYSFWRPAKEEQKDGGQ